MSASVLSLCWAWAETYARGVPGSYAFLSLVLPKMPNSAGEHAGQTQENQRENPSHQVDTRRRVSDQRQLGAFVREFSSLPCWGFTPADAAACARVHAVCALVRCASAPVLDDVLQQSDRHVCTTRAAQRVQKRPK